MYAYWTSIWYTIWSNTIIMPCLCLLNLCMLYHLIKYHNHARFMPLNIYMIYQLIKYHNYAMFMPVEPLYCYTNWSNTLIMPCLCLLNLYMLYHLIKYYNYARFMPVEPLYAIPTDQIPARSHQSAAIIHMLLNNLDPRLGKNVIFIFYHY